MSNAGALGTLLVEKFGGERGRCYPNQDSEFLIVFENEKGAPNHDAIAQTVEAYYTALGYKFEREQSSTALLPMLVLLPEDEEWVFLTSLSLLHIRGMAVMPQCE